MRRVQSASLVPDSEPTVHLVLDDFGKLGRVYRETDDAEADEKTIIENLTQGQYEKPVRVISFNLSEGWVRDVSEDIAGAVLADAERSQKTLTSATQDFVEFHLGLMSART
jgi:hypothetical protein